MILIKYPEAFSNFINSPMASGQTGMQPSSSNKHYLVIFPPVALIVLGQESHSWPLQRCFFSLLVVKMPKGNQKGRGKDVGYSLPIPDSEPLRSTQISQQVHLPVEDCIRIITISLIVLICWVWSEDRHINWLNN